MDNTSSHIHNISCNYQENQNESAYKISLQSY
jgi:hypothetical protein